VAPADGVVSDEIAADPPVGVIGLGTMGGRIARRLLDRDRAVIVWNRTPERAADIEAAGATVADSPADVAARCPTVVVMVTDAAALAAVTEGPSGCLAGARDGSVVVDLSTVGVAAERRLAAALPAAVGHVHAPVLGSAAEAASGGLTIFAGGEPAAVRQVYPLLALLGTVVEAGSVEDAAAAKLVANAGLLGVVALLGEVVALADRLGLARDRAFEVLASTPLGAQAERRRTALEAAHYPPRFALALAAKDAALIEDAAAGADVRLLRAAATWYADANAAGLGGRDYTAVLAQITGGDVG
jgi:3-hydroxyisobutyrate dehydrogenase-like beta-hydroxyacid dehydrogenase